MAALPIINIGKVLILYISAVKVADKMQKEVTLKRSEIDSLKTKVRWLEDKLDSLTRVCNHGNST